MDEEVFNMSVRKFLKKLGVTAQREIELAVREQLDGGDLQGDETLDATATREWLTDRLWTASHVGCEAKNISSIL